MHKRLPASGAVWSLGRERSASLTRISLRPDYPPGNNSGVVSHLKQDCVCVLGGPQETDRFENIIAQFVLNKDNFYLHFLCQLKENTVILFISRNYISQITVVVTDTHFQSFSKICFHSSQ